MVAIFATWARAGKDDNLSSSTQYPATFETCKASSKTSDVEEDACSLASLSHSDSDVDIGNYSIPKNYDLDRVLEAVIRGPGYFKLKGMFSEADMAMARERVLYYTNPYTRLKDKDLNKKDEQHNHYEGMIWVTNFRCHCLGSLDDSTNVFSGPLEQGQDL